MVYHESDIPGNPSLPDEIERRARELAKRSNLTEAQTSLARLATRMAWRARQDVDRTPAASGDIWAALWSLGEQLAAIDAPDVQPPLTIKLPKPFRDFSGSVWQVEKRPVRSKRDDE